MSPLLSLEHLIGVYIDMELVSFPVSSTIFTSQSCFPLMLAFYFFDQAGLYGHSRLDARDGLVSRER